MKSPKQIADTIIRYNGVSNGVVTYGALTKNSMRIARVAADKAAQEATEQVLASIQGMLDQSSPEDPYAQGFKAGLRALRAEIQTHTKTWHVVADTKGRPTVALAYHQAQATDLAERWTARATTGITYSAVEAS